MDDYMIRKAMSEYVPPPRPMIEVEKQIEMLDEILDPLTSVQRQEFLACTLHRFVNYPETEIEELIYLASLSGLKQLKQIIDNCSSHWPNKSIPFTAAILCVLTYKRNLVTYKNALASKILETVSKIIEKCTPLFDKKKSEIMWSCEEEDSWRLLFIQAVSIATSYTYDPARPDRIPKFGLQTFMTIKELFDKIVSGKVESNGWNIDTYGSCVILYINIVLGCKTYSDLFVESGVKDLLTFLGQKRTPEDYSEITKIYDINIFQIIDLICRYSLDALDTAEIADALTNYVELNSDYILYYHEIYSKDKILLWIVSIINDMCVRSSKAAFHFYYLNMPTLLLKFIDVPIDDFNYEIGSNRMEPINSVFLNGNYPPNEKVVRDISGMVLSTFILIKCAVYKLMDTKISLEEFDNMFFALHTKAPDQIIISYGNEYIEGENERKRQEEIEMQRIHRSSFESGEDELGEEELGEEEEYKYEIDDADCEDDDEDDDDDDEIEDNDFNIEDEQDDELSDTIDVVKNLNSSKSQDAFENNELLPSSEMEIDSQEENYDAPIDISSAESVHEQFIPDIIENLEQPPSTNVVEIEQPPLSSADTNEEIESQDIPIASFGEMSLDEDEIFENEVMDTVEFEIKNSTSSQSTVIDKTELSSDKAEKSSELGVESKSDTSDLVEIKTSSELEVPKDDNLSIIMPEDFEEFDNKITTNGKSTPTDISSKHPFEKPSSPDTIEPQDLQSDLKPSDVENFNHDEMENFELKLEITPSDEDIFESQPFTEKETIATDQVKNEVSSVFDPSRTDDIQDDIFQSLPSTEKETVGTDHVKNEVSSDFDPSRTDDVQEDIFQSQPSTEKETDQVKNEVSSVFDPSRTDDVQEDIFQSQPSTDKETVATDQVKNEVSSVSDPSSTDDVQEEPSSEASSIPDKQ